MASETGAVRASGPQQQPDGPRVPDDVRVYAVGDIHGRADLLDQIMQRIIHDSNAAAPARETILVFVGDYIDRGPDSAGVLDRLIKLKSDERFTTYLLKGNHEVMFLDFLAEPSAFFQWAANGGVTTLESYDIDVIASRDESPQRLRQTALAAVPDSHLLLLRSLENSRTIGDYMFAHAGVRPGVPLDEQREEDLVWIRQPFLDFEGDFGKTIIHGHTPVQEPDIRANRIDIDTLAWRSGVLTALVLEGAKRRFLQT